MANRADDFNRSDGAVGTPSDGGAAWGEIGFGSYSVISNTCGCGSSGSQAIAYLDASSADVEIEVTLATSGTQPGLAARVVDGNSHLLVSIEPGVPRARMFKKTASSTFVQLGSTHSGSYSNGDVLYWSLDSSDNLVFKQNGTTRISAADAYNNTATLHGLRTNSDTTTRYDDFSITDLAGGGGTQVAVFYYHMTQSGGMA